MPLLVDTNILLRAAQASHPMHEVAGNAVSTLKIRDEKLFTTIQNIAEFWNVATRPLVNNGLGFDIKNDAKRSRRA